MAGPLRIGAPQDFGSDRLTKLIAKFQKKFPMIYFHLHLSPPLEQLDLLCSGKLDLCFVDNGGVHIRNYPVTIQRGESEEFVLAGAESLVPKKIQRNQDWKALSEQRFVDYFPHGPVVKLWFEHEFGKSPQQPLVVYSAESVRALLTAMRAGMGLGVVPRRLLSGENSNLRVVESQRKPWINQILIARWQAAPLSARESEFSKFYKEASRPK